MKISIQIATKKKLISVTGFISNINSKRHPSCFVPIGTVQMPEENLLDMKIDDNSEIPLKIYGKNHNFIGSV